MRCRHLLRRRARLPVELCRQGGDQIWVGRGEISLLLGIGEEVVELRRVPLEPDQLGWMANDGAHAAEHLIVRAAGPPHGVALLLDQRREVSAPGCELADVVVVLGDERAGTDGGAAVRGERTASQVLRHRHDRPFEHGRHEVGELHGRVDHRRRHIRKTVDDERYVQKRLPHAEVVLEQAVLAEMLAMIRGDDGDQRARCPRAVEHFLEMAKLPVSLLDVAEIETPENGHRAVVARHRAEVILGLLGQSMGVQPLRSYR